MHVVCIYICIYIYMYIYVCIYVLNYHDSQARDAGHGEGVVLGALLHDVGNTLWVLNCI